MRIVVRHLVWLVVALLAVQPACAAFDDARVWFDELSLEAREATQNDLLLIGKYDHLIDGQFGRATFDALVAFQSEQNRPATGVLTPAESESLATLAREVETRLGLAEVIDAEARAVMRLPLALLTERRATGTGTSYASKDSEFSIETMYASLATQSFAELYNRVLRPDPEQVVLAQSFGPKRFVVSGRQGGYSFYTMFVSAGTEAAGFSLAWGTTYSAEGPLIASYLASHFVPQALLDPKDGGRIADAPPPGRSDAFRLPPDQPDLIVLNAEITNTTPADFDRALEQRPKASTLVLNSPGGDIDSAIAMAREVHRLGMTTYVADQMGCYSACAYVFFAGKDRWAAGELGVHQIYTEIETGVPDLVLAQATLGDVLDALVDFGVRQPVISHMLRTPPDNMYVFSPGELKEYAINHGAPIRRHVAVVDTVSEPRPYGAAAYVQLASFETVQNAMRSVGYANERWGNLFGGAMPEVESHGDLFRVRLPVDSVELANSICAAVQSDGGGCYVTTDGT